MLARVTPADLRSNRYWFIMGRRSSRLACRHCPVLWRGELNPSTAYNQQEFAVNKSLEELEKAVVGQFIAPTGTANQPEVNPDAL